MHHRQKNEKRRRWVARKVRTSRSTSGASHPRLVVFRSAKHIYAQLVDPQDGHTIGSVSTLQEALRSGGSTGNVEAAKRVGTAVAALAAEKQIERVVFNRNGFLYHGRVKALADAAREAGLKF
jgi:large subunit ribosomal protein L18